MSGRRVVGLGVAIVIAVAGFLLMRHQQAVSSRPPVLEAALHGSSQDKFFEMIAAYCQKHPEASDAASCAMCDSQTCPTCGFGPERTQLVSACNADGWDCAGSFLFAPHTGGSCAFGTSGGCQCPQGGASRKSEASPANRLAVLIRPALPAAPFSPRPSP